nr:DNA cytosine methyltransferase [Deinococcus arboris]
MTTISLFSGAMGLDLGLEEAGFQTLACVEVNEAACATIRANRPELSVICRDIREVSSAEIMEAAGVAPEEVTLVVGGPPCQPFSTAGRRKGINDPRGSLFMDFVRVINDTRPAFFIMENVRGLLSQALSHRPLNQRGPGNPPLGEDEQPGSVLRVVLEEFERIGYRVDYFAVNAVNHGAPQIRERVFFIGNRLNLAVDWPDPSHGLPPQKGQRPFETLGSVLMGWVDPDPVIMDFSPRKKHYLSHVPPGGNWRDLPEELQRESMGAAWHAKGGRSGWWRRLSYEYPSPTIVTMPNHASTSLCHPEEVRTLTVGECARVQGFPEHWHFVGTPLEQYTQVGNAVPVQLGKLAGEVVRQALDSPQNAAQPMLFNVPSRGRNVQSTVRTRMYHVGSKQWLADRIGWTKHKEKVESD